MGKLSWLFCCGNKINKYKTKPTAVDEKLELIGDIISTLHQKTKFLDSLGWKKTEKCVQVDLLGITDEMNYHVELGFKYNAPAVELINLLKPYLIDNFKKRNPQLLPQAHSYLASHIAQQILSHLFKVPFTKPYFNNYNFLQTKTFPQDKLDEFRKSFWQNMDEESFDKNDIFVMVKTYEELIINTVKDITPNKLCENAYNDWHEQELKLITQQTINKEREESMQEEVNERVNKIHHYF